MRETSNDIIAAKVGWVSVNVLKMRETSNYIIAAASSVLVSVVKLCLGWIWIWVFYKVLEGWVLCYETGKLSCLVAT